MTIYLATGNLGKKREISQILYDYIIKIPSDDGIDFNPKETGSTFYENSIIKARALWEIVHKPVIADDSGLCVDALGGNPGIYSARYAGPTFMQGRLDGKKIPQDEQNRLLIEQTNRTLEDNNDLDTSSFPNGPRSARYICSMVLFFNPSRLFIAQETLEGALISSIKDARGNGGFGYDPIVFLPKKNCTVAELSATEKNAISHRGKATRIIETILRNMIL